MCVLREASVRVNVDSEAADDGASIRQVCWRRRSERLLMRRWRRGEPLNYGICGAVAAACAHRCVWTRRSRCPAEDLLRLLRLAACVVVSAVRTDEWRPGRSDRGHHDNHLA